jgi:hypothetical protein
MCRSAKAKQTHSLTWFHSSNPKAPEPDDAGTKQRRSVQIVHCLRKRKDKVGTGRGIFRVTAVDCITGKSWRIAEIFQSVIAVPAGAVDTTTPGNSNPGSLWQLCRFPDNFAHDLVTWN